jgi:hypothetical protein
MVKRSLAYLPIVLFYAVMFGAAPLRPCDSQNSAMAAELSEPAPQPTLVLPSEPVPAGELIDVSVLAAVPTGATPNLQWKLNGQPVDAKHARITADGLGAVLALPAGKHTITVRGGWGVVVEGQVALTFVDLEGLITVGHGPQPPPVPPGPEPPGPVVPPAPVVEGPRTVVIVHESADQTPAQARLFTALRAGTVAQYIASKGHNLLILDDDSVDQGGRPIALVAKLTALGDPLPFMAVLETNTGNVLNHRPLTPAANADGVLAVLKENGG